MILPIDEKYRIKSDEHSWKIQEKVKATHPKTREIMWTNVGHYIKLKACVNGLAEHMLRTSDAETLVEALEEVKRVTDLLSRALSPEYEVTIK